MTMNELDNKWLEDVRNTMADYSEELPSDGWQALSASLDAKACPQISPKQGWGVSFSLRRIAVAAAFTAFFGVWCYMPTAYDSLSIEMPMEYAQVPIIQDSEAHVNENLEKDVQQGTEVVRLASAKRVEPQSGGRDNGVMSGANVAASDTQMMPETISESEQDAATEEMQSEGVEQTETTQEAGTSKSLSMNAPLPNSDNSKSTVPSLTTTKQRQSQNPYQNTDSRWTLGLHCGGNGTGGEASSDFMFDGSGLLEGPDEYHKKEEESDRVINSDSHMSFSVGVSLGKQLTTEASIVSGLVYSRLTSDVEILGKGWADQTLHYLGVPIVLKYDFFESRPWSFYGAAGTMFERCLKGDRGGEKLTINKIQMSISATAGCQYRLFDNLGIYVEPGVRYYFNDNSGVPTFRSERPCTFNFQVGVRFNY